MLLRTDRTDEDVDAVDALRFSVFNSLLSETLGPKTVDLRLQGISSSVNVASHSIGFQFGGFNIETMNDLMKTSLDLPVETNDARFDRIIENLKAKLVDKSDMPVQYAMQDRSMLLQKHGGHSDEELLQALESGKVTQDSVLKIMQHFVGKPLQSTTTIFGNLNEDDAKKFAKTMKEGAQQSLQKHA